MIDTITGYMELNRTKFKDIEHLLHNATIREKDKCFIYVCSVSNFKIKLFLDSNSKPYRISFNGSLAKFYFGNNLEVLDLKATRLAIESLSKELGVNLSKAKITRLDFGINVSVKHPVHEYISSIQSYPRLKFGRYKETISFFSFKGSKALTFYDKIYQLKNRDPLLYNKLPIHIKNLNLLRFEVRFKKNLNSNLGTKNLTMNNLYQERIFSLLQQQLIDTLDRVHIMETNNIPDSTILKDYGLKNFLSIYGLFNLGYNRVLNLISDQKFDVKNESVKKSRLRKQLIEINKLLDRSNPISANFKEELKHRIKIAIDIL